MARAMAAAGGLLAAAGAAAQTPTDKAIVVAPDTPEFEITVESNPTTGYAWYLDFIDADLIEVRGHAYQAPTADRLGAGGIETWKFAARSGAFKVPRVTTIVLRYLRAVEPDSGQEQSFTVLLAGKR